MVFIFRFLKLWLLLVLEFGINIDIDVLDLSILKVGLNKFKDKGFEVFQ